MQHAFLGEGCCVGLDCPPGWAVGMGSAGIPRSRGVLVQASTLVSWTSHYLPSAARVSCLGAGMAFMSCDICVLLIPVSTLLVGESQFSGVPGAWSLVFLEGLSKPFPAFGCEVQLSVVSTPSATIPSHPIPHSWTAASVT